MNFSCVLRSSGSALGSHRITNEDLSSFLDTNHEWIFSRTGIEERPLKGPEESLLDLAEKASRRALDKIHLLPQDLDLIVVATSGGDETFPPLGVSLAQRLGCSSMAFDMNVACSGYLYALDIARGYLGSLLEKNPSKPLKGLVVGAECMSRLVSWEDRTTAVLFGDGAGATVLEVQNYKPYEEKTPEASMASSPQIQGIVDSLFVTLPKGRDSLYVSDWKGEGDYKDKENSLEESEDHSKIANSKEDFLRYLQTTLHPQNTYRQRGVIHMKGQDVFRHAVLSLERISRDILSKNDISIDDVSWVIPHQANKRILETLGERLGLEEKRLLYTGYLHGNLSAASIPVTLNYFWEKNYFSPGDLILLQSFGAGFTCGAILLRW